MGRILAIDYGTKRVGIAVTDPLKIIATPLDTVHSSKIFEFLETYITKEPVEKIIIGYPTQLDNSDTNNSRHVKQFATTLSKKLPTVQWEYMDERYTSKIAMDAMIAGGTKKSFRQQKVNIDKISATILLQDYLQKQTS